ncbi:MAG TPA: polysaccharide deacetylase family protein [Jatrophihabitantaceae bacterium]|jgi:peptidoglycan/xylan/chitin deacetylase (PgdA/CDA1 family)|nr:polysaccharide deacetylase family protein [Jatrophihabitantaceae bacterium]
MNRIPRLRSVRTAGVVAALSLLASVIVLPAVPAGAATAPKKPTVVSLTFDDSNADQAPAEATMRALGMHGTFYTITGSIGAPNYLTLSQLQQIYRDGNEIGGHTVNHPDLTLVPADEAQRQVCQARNTLTKWGFPQTSFAYPFASVTTAVESIVSACGYNSARGLGDIQSRFGCAGCDFSETMPPADPFYLKALDEVDDTWTLADLEKTVTNAESHGGGWVILTFHHICNNKCDPLSITPALFTTFLTWLSAHDLLTPTTSVKTVNQVIGGAVKPAVTPPAPPAVPGALANASLETAGPDGGINCWTPYNWGTNTSTFTSVGSAHTGSVAEQVTITGYSNGAAGIYPTFDTGGCSPAAIQGHTYTVSAWYKATTVVQFVAYYRDPQGGFDYWTSGPYIPASTTWAQATWTTPALPAGASGISFGLSLFSNGTLTTDDYTYADSASLPPPVVPTAMGNASLETAGINGMPSCWTPSTFGTNNAAYAESTPGHTGNTAVTVTISSYTNGAGQLLPSMYGSTCAPAVAAGHTYALSAWYQSTAVTQFIAYYLTTGGSWVYWTSSPWLAASSSWTQASWTTPAVPAGATRVAFGLSLFSVGSLVTDDYGFAQAS